MQLTLHYGSRVISLPYGRVEGKLAEAGKKELAVLLAACADPEASVSKLADQTGTTEDDVLCALAFWQDAGALTVRFDPGEKLPESRKAAQEKTPVSGELPVYSTEEVATALENNRDLSGLIDACQREMGRMLSTVEIRQIVAISDYLALSPDYLLLLFHHCAKKGLRSVRAVETAAIRLFDKGIVTYEALEEALRAEEAIRSSEGRIRTMFGLGSRALTKREQEYLTDWIVVWEMEMDVIEKAYEITADNIGKVNFRYTNKILESWHQAGYRTADQVNAALEAYRSQKTAAVGGTFDTDAFFEAALRRSYGETGPVNSK